VDESNTDQASGQSVEEAIADKFSRNYLPQEPEQQEAPEPVAQAESESESEPQEEVEEVEYEGSRYQVPKPLKKAIMQEADYTRKTQEIAEKRQLLEQSQSNLQLVMMENEFHQSVAEEVHNLKSLDKHIEALEQTDYNQMDSDSIVRHLASIQKAKAIRDQLSKKIESAHADFKDKFGKQLSEARKNAHDLLAKTVSGYSPDSFKEARKYGSDLGFPEQVLDSIEADPKAARVLYEAMSYRKLVASKAAAVKKLDAPVVKPGSSKPMPAEVKDKLNYRKQLSSAKTRDERNAIIQKRVEGMFG
jgi:hypothetical protein